MTENRARRVLIVEDSPAMRQLLSLGLARIPGIAIEQAPDGVAALRALRATEIPYDLVFLDVNMPIMDGMNLLARLRAEGGLDQTAVCVVTTSEDEETERRARELGARFYVRKPVNRKQLEGIARELFGLPGATGRP